MSERLPRSSEELESLARHYDDTDASDEIAEGRIVTPEPMVTTSLRLPRSVVEQLRREAGRRGMRYTTLLREVAEQHVTGSSAVDQPASSATLERLEGKLDGLTKEVRGVYENQATPPAPDR